MNHSSKEIVQPEQVLNSEPEADNNHARQTIAKPNVMRRFFGLLTKKEWDKWKHVMFVQDFRSGIKTYEILRRECKLTGNVQYRRVYVKQCVHNLVHSLTEWWVSLNGA